MVHLNNIWFVIIAVFWVGFFVLEGFDFGVGMLHSFVGKNDVERRIAVNSIGPIWDGNEVWLMWGGGDLRRVPLLVRHDVLHLLPDPCAGSPGFDRPRGFIGFPPQNGQPTVAGDMEMVAHAGERPHPLPARHCSGRPPQWAAHEFVAQLHRELLGLLVPSGSMRGHAYRALMLLGATYLTLKTEGAVHERVARLSSRSGWVAAAITFGWLTWSHVGLGTGFALTRWTALRSSQWSARQAGRSGFNGRSSQRQQQSGA